MTERSASFERMCLDCEHWEAPTDACDSYCKSKTSEFSGVEMDWYMTCSEWEPMKKEASDGH